jgi:hypothetical protein
LRIVALIISVAKLKTNPMTKPELVELSASEMQGISAGYSIGSRRPRLGGLIVLLLALLLRSRVAVPVATERVAE